MLCYAVCSYGDLLVCAATDNVAACLEYDCVQAGEECDSFVAARIVDE